MDGKRKNVTFEDVKEIPLADILSEEAMGKQDIFAKLLSTIFVKYRVDSDLQRVLRESIKDISQTIAEECFLFGYDNGYNNGYAAGHKDGKTSGLKEAKDQAEKKAVLQLQNKLEEELVRELLMSMAPGGRLQ